MGDPSVIPVTAVYVSETTFTLDGNYTSDFHTDRRIRARCDALRKHGTILSSSYGAGVTTVILTADSDDLDSNLDGVWLGEITAPSNDDSCLPKHLHTAEDLGGVLSSYILGSEIDNQIESIDDDTNEVIVSFDDIGSTNYVPIINIINLVDNNPAAFATTTTAINSDSFTVKLSGKTDSSNYKLVWFVKTF
jgi:hypothetical protein